MKLEEKSSNSRLTVIALILAVFFGILQYIPKTETFKTFGIEVTLKVAASTFFGVVLIIFLVYLILYAINSGYGFEGVIPEVYLKHTYNLAVLLTFIIIFMVVGLVLIFSLIAPLSITIASYSLIIFIVVTAILFGRIKY